METSLIGFASAGYLLALADLLAELFALENDFRLDLKKKQLAGLRLIPFSVF